ncbi:MAG: AgrD family cyclic lactone autoinducer peptide [Oscillospiraceae bacterium]
MTVTMITTVTVNSACTFYTHQELLPQVDKKLRKF